MLSSKDYSKMTLEELIAAEKKLQSQKISTAVVIGAVIGVAVYSATHKGLILPVILLIVAFGIGNRYAQNLKSMQAEISRRDATR